MRKYYVAVVVLIGISGHQSIAEECYGPKLARDAIRAVALVSNKSMITDMVGNCLDVCNLWANYRYHKYSDQYAVSVNEKECRVLNLTLVKAKGPIKEAE